MNESNGMATASLVLGIVGFILSLAPFVGWLTFPIWIVAIILGVIGRKQLRGQGIATTGMVLGIITIVYKFGFWVILAASVPVVHK